MKKSTLALVVTVLFSLAGVMLRALSLAYEFDPHTQLLARRAPLAVAVAILGLPLALAVFLLLRRNKAIPARPRELERIWLLPQMAAALCLAGAGVVYLLRYFSIGGVYFESESIPVLVFALLSLLAALSIAVVALQAVKGKLASGYGLYLTIPVFWGCYHMVLDFWSYAGNPVLANFAFAILSFTCLTLAMYNATRCFYENNKKRMFALFSLMGVFFASIALLGSVIAKIFLITGPVPLAADLSLPRILILSFVLLHSLSLFWLSEKNLVSDNYVPPLEEDELPSLSLEEAEGIEGIAVGLDLNLDLEALAESAEQLADIEALEMETEASEE